MATLWDDARGDFPGLLGKTYVNAAATSLTPRPVREAVTAFYRELEEGGDRHWDAWLDRREAIRRKVARFVGAQPEEIAFVPNTSTGMNLIADLLESDGPVLSDELVFMTWSGTLWPNWTNPTNWTPAQVPNGDRRRRGRRRLLQRADARPGRRAGRWPPPTGAPLALRLLAS